MKLQINRLERASMELNNYAFGYLKIEKDQPKFQKNLNARINVFNALSYIPGVNIITAIVAMFLLRVDISTLESDDKYDYPSKIVIHSAYKSQILRLFFSTLMILPDAFIGFARLSFNNKKNNYINSVKKELSQLKQDRLRISILIRESESELAKCAYPNAELSERVKRLRNELVEINAKREYLKTPRKEIL